MNHKGFTLIEVLVVLTITSCIGGGAAAAVYQVININALSGNHVIAVKQVENAVYWIGRDVQMAQVLQPGGVSGFPLSLSWVEWDNTGHQVAYVLEDGQIRRSHSVNGGEPTWLVVADHINASSEKTNCQYAEGVFTFKVTSFVSGFRSATESRVVQVIPRPAP